MLNNKATKAGIALGVFLTLLLAGTGFYGCGADSSVSSDQGPTIGPGPVVPAAGVTPTVGAQIAVSAVAPAANGQVTVNIPNTFANGNLIIDAGAPVVIVGSNVLPNTPNTVTSATPTSINVAATLPPTIPPVITGVVQVQGGVVPSATCLTTAITGATSAISLPKSSPAGAEMDIVPSRVAGVAPLAVFFDATGTSVPPLSAITRPFHELEYRWNFGDDDTVTWANGAHVGDGSVLAKKNRGSGPVAAHVFETAGTYTVTFTVTDGINTVSNNCVKIAVSDPDVVFAGPDTICVAVAALPVAGSGGCPANATVRQTGDFSTAISYIAGSKKRLLFNRGEIWTSAAGGAVTATGPGIVGAYGSGAKPIVQAVASTDILTLGSSSSPAFGDWRVMDLVFDGSTAPATCGGTGCTSLPGGSVGGIWLGGTAINLTILRFEAHDVHFGIELIPGAAALNGNAMQSQWAIVDSHISNIVGGNAGYGMFVSGKSIAVLGNFIDDTTQGEHDLRVRDTSKAVISNNTAQFPAVTKQVITVRSPSWAGAPGVYPPGTYTEYVLVSDNKLNGGIGGPAIAFESPDQTLDNRARTVIAERNWVISGSGTISGILDQASDATIRNNIVDISATVASSRYGIKVQAMTAAAPGNGFPVPDSVRIYNNTIYSSAATSDTFIGVQLQTNAGTNITIQNNLAYAPNHGTVANVNGIGGVTGPVTTCASCNSSDIQVNSTSPAFAGALTAPAGFRLTAGSYAITSNTINAGVPVPVFSDFFLQSRTTSDLGAVKFP